MAIASTFAIATHILAYLATQPPEKTTSERMAASIGANSVIVRNILALLKRAGFVSTQQGVSGAKLTKSVQKITLLDIYRAVKSDKELFSMHQNPSPNCPVGSRIQKALEKEFKNAQIEREKKLAGSTMLDVIKGMNLKLR